MHSVAQLDFSLQLFMKNSVRAHICSIIFRTKWLDVGVGGIMEPRFTFQLCGCAAAVRYQQQKEQFKMIMKRLLSYGDGKCGVWHALPRKSLDVTRGV